MNRFQILLSNFAFHFRLYTPVPSMHSYDDTSSHHVHFTDEAGMPLEDAAAVGRSSIGQGLTLVSFSAARDNFLRGT
jgi:hypothetical protein